MTTTATRLALTPDRETFRALAREGNLIPVSLTLLADMDTPVSIFRRFADEPYAFLLESVQGGERWASHSFIGIRPFATLRAEGRDVVVTVDGVTTRAESDPVEALRTLLGSYSPVDLPGLPRFAGGAVGYFGYDTVRHFERLPVLAEDDLPMPDACFMLAEDMVVFHHLSCNIQLLHLARLAPGDDADAAYDKAEAAIAALRDRLAAPMPAAPANTSDAPLTFTANFTEAQFLETVEAAKEHIRAGDIFQMVLSQRFSVETPASPFDIYRALRAINPSPYMYCVRFPESTVVGASPEVLFRVEGTDLTVRPIAGTRPRGRTPEEDQAHEISLKADPKELAEHVMLIDLGRNDVGRVAALGSVKVVDQMVIERYSHVMHLVSSVAGTLATGLDAFDALKATFPAGTLSGAPKVRAMELIEQFEPTRRGLYGGVVGYVGFNGNADLAIAIRTLVAFGDTKVFQTGAGIVYDSDPQSEYQETLAKARAIRRAIECAHTGLGAL